MSLTVVVNVSVDNVKEANKKDYDYKGKFQFQQISPLDKIYVKKNGNIDAELASAEVDVELNWVSNAVEIDGRLYSAQFRCPSNESIWILEGEGKEPGPSDPAPSSGNYDIIVPDNGNGRALTIKDGNAFDKKYKYCLVVEVDKDGGKLLVEDPMIVNRRPVRLSGKPPKGKKCAPAPGQSPAKSH